jgi:hypothetical protein
MESIDYLRELAAVAPDRGSASLHERHAAEWIAQRLRCMGYTVSEQNSTNLSDPVWASLYLADTGSDRRPERKGRVHPAAIRRSFLRLGKAGVRIVNQTLPAEATFSKRHRSPEVRSQW